MAAVCGADSAPERAASATTGNDERCSAVVMTVSAHATDVPETRAR